MKKNLILIVADHLRYDVLGKGYTPNIDAITAEGIRFDRAYCACPLCVPARGALFTGLSPNTNGCLINPWLAQDASHGEVHKGIPNLYSILAENGWDCIHSGKQHLYTEGGKMENDPDSPIHWASTPDTYRAHLSQDGKPIPGGPRFRTPVPELSSGRHTRLCGYSNAETGRYEPGADYYFDNFFTDKTIEALQHRDTEKPLFLSAMFLAPHPPLEIPDPWYSRIKPEEVKLPENVGRWYLYQSPLQMYNLPGVVGGRYTREQWKESWRVYLGLVSLLDDCVGRIVDELKRQGIYDDSLIVVTSDHGDMMGSHRLYQKMCMYEESAHIPLTIRLPGARHAGQIVPNTISHLDLLPTLCHYLDIPAPAGEGRPLTELIEGGTLPEKDIYIQFDGNGALSNFQRCVVRGGYKLIADVFKDEVYFELYDTIHDPLETENLLFGEAIPAIAYELLGSLLDHMALTHDKLALPSIDLERFVEDHRPLPARQNFHD